MTLTVSPDHGLAQGLSNAHYVDPEVHVEENARVLAASWASVGFAKDIPNPGDVMPVEFVGNPLLLVRGKDMQVRVFENVCRHRGMKLVEEPGQLKSAIACRYHAWCYDFEGALLTTPHVGGTGVHTLPEVDKSKLGLLPVRAEVWMDVIFVNISGTAAPFADFIKPLVARWSEFANKPVYHGGPDSSFYLEVNCNWKLAIENYCESYHLPWVHPDLNRYSKLSDHYEIIDESGDFSGQGTTVYAPSLGADGQRFKSFEGLSEKWDAGAEYISLFPNTLLGIHKDHYFAIRIEPMGPAKTREHIELYYTDPDMTAEGWRFMREANARMWKQVFEEDIFAVEGMQKGRHSKGFDGGAFTPVMDRPTKVFHEWVSAKFNGA